MSDSPSGEKASAALQDVCLSTPILIGGIAKMLEFGAGACIP